MIIQLHGEVALFYVLKCLTFMSLIFMGNKSLKGTSGIERRREAV
jgi:hypothetical protein